MVSYVHKRNRSINTSPICRKNQWLRDRKKLYLRRKVSLCFFYSQVWLHLHAIHPKLGRSGYANAFWIINWSVVDFACGTSDRRIKLYDQRIVPHSNASLHCHALRYVSMCRTLLCFVVCNRLCQWLGFQISRLRVKCFRSVRCGYSFKFFFLLFRCGAEAIHSSFRCRRLFSEFNFSRDVNRFLCWE